VGHGSPGKGNLLGGEGSAIKITSQKTPPPPPQQTIHLPVVGRCWASLGEANGIMSDAAYGTAKAKHWIVEEGEEESRLRELNEMIGSRHAGHGSPHQLILLLPYMDI